LLPERLASVDDEFHRRADEGDLLGRRRSRGASAGVRRLLHLAGIHQLARHHQVVQPVSCKCAITMNRVGLDGKPTCQLTIQSTKMGVELSNL
jgi:hypothetical protein